MTALAVVPPDALVGVVESMPEITREVRALLADGAAYRLAVPDGEATGEDVYLDLVAGPDASARCPAGPATRWRPCSPTAAATRTAPASATRSTPCCGGRRATASPAGTTTVLGAGRPGWHIECTAISLDRLGHPLDIQGGGTDLVFPHHEMSAVQSAALTHDDTFARHYVHQAMVGYEGAKMSKSRGNLVLVSRLRADGVDPMAIRLVLLDQHYRTDWDYTPDLLDAALARLARWREALSVNQGAEATATIAAVRAAIADDLDTRAALAAVDDWAERTLGGRVGRRGRARARGAHGGCRARRPPLTEPRLEERPRRLAEKLLRGHRGPTC